MVLPVEHIADVFVDVARQLRKGFDPAEFLHLVAEYARQFSGAQAAAVLLTDQNGQLQHMAATTERARILQNTAEHFDDGPCQECQRTGTPVVVEDLVDALDRWPEFTPRALTMGYEAVHVLPLLAAGHQAGTLKLFLPRNTPLDQTRLKLVHALADIFTLTVVHARELHEAKTVNSQLQVALESRVVIEQAKGALARHMGICVDDAFHILRSYARHHRYRLTELCHEVIDNHAALTLVASFTPKPAAIRQLN